MSYSWQNNNGNLSSVFISALVFIVTSAEREVRDSGRSGIDLFGQDWAREIRRILDFRFFDEVKAELVRDISRSLRLH